MSDPVIEFDHVYKKFARGEQHTTLRDLIPALISSWWNKKRIDEQALKGEEFWAVNDVSLSVPRGEALGIIGPNGSGKSTILKLLSGILRPDRGTYSVKGRLSALIEVGAGFSIQRNLLLKVSFQHNSRDGGPLPTAEQLGAAQLVYWF